MKKIIVFNLLIAQLMSQVAPAMADPITQKSETTTLIQSLPNLQPTTGEIDVGAAISPLKKGQISPFTGVLLSPKATASIIVQMGNLQEQIKIEADNAKEKAEAQCEYDKSSQKIEFETDKKILQAQLDSKILQISELDKIIKENEKNKSNTPLWVGAGIAGGLIVGVGLTVLTAYSLNQVSK